MKIAFLLILLASPCAAHDPYQNLYVPGTSNKCCGGGPDGDCFETNARMTATGDVQAFIPADRNVGYDQKSHGPTWVTVPPAKILPIDENPVAGPMICYLRGNVRCFLPGRGG